MPCPDCATEKDRAEAAERACAALREALLDACSCDVMNGWTCGVHVAVARATGAGYVKVCRHGMGHAKPCALLGDGFVCACGCAGDETWCLDGYVSPEEHARVVAENARMREGGEKMLIEGATERKKRADAERENSALRRVAEAAEAFVRMQPWGALREALCDALRAAGNIG